MSALSAIEGLAAGATLLLACATVWLGLQARRAAQEAARARLDQLGPSVTVREASVERTPIARDAVGSGSHSLKAMLAWPESQCGHVELGVRCWILIVNEGSRTAMVRVSLSRGTVLEGTWKEPEAGELPTLMDPLAQRNSWWLLDPGAKGKMALVTWKTTADWARAVHDADGSLATEVRLECWSEPGSVVDRCSVSYRKFPLWPGSGGGLIIAAPDLVHLIPDPPPDDAVTVSEMTRSYPK